MPRKPWQIPVEYVEDRFEPGEIEALAAQVPADTDDDTKNAQDVKELLSRPDDRPERVYECKDTTPIDYNKGPHDDEFGVADKDELGPPDEEFNLDDEDENALEPAEDLYPDEPVD